MSALAFHEKGGRCQSFFRGGDKFISLPCEHDSWPAECFCRHPSIRTRCERFIARCKLGVLDSAGAATCYCDLHSILQMEYWARPMTQSPELGSDTKPPVPLD